MTIIHGNSASVESVTAPQEAQALRQIAHMLTNVEGGAKLVGANGEQVDIPESLYQVLHHVVHALVKGQVISVIPQNCEMTTQQAADFLNVSRPYLIKLLEQGEIPYIKVGSHRRIPFADLMKYKEQRDVKRSQFLQQLISMSEEAGLSAH
ncbi:helix-turn-helix domain-containing protein [Iningainema tapete]|uniref:Helix-turn-helix domain-containing protein n=1 Tax=Iningainema tapete BLCC-T55 TaxID=2748662 RepID=A0A8J6XLE9_9CYAN|nr:helix-turn-helix domain-containing protein [Iningainema tapete]MBD2773031.1 helix-turn-helix domain-containing protein [Iningainema tapete BLCC-T55]